MKYAVSEPMINAGEYDAITDKALWTSKADPVRSDGLNSKLKSNVIRTATLAKKPRLTALLASFFPYFSFKRSVEK